MAYYALVDSSNLVVNIIGAEEDFPSTDWARELAGQGQWVAYTPEQPARRGDTYYPSRNIFMSPSPWPSWQLDPVEAQWHAPQPLPDLNNNYQWNEDLGQWQQVNRTTGHEAQILAWLKNKYPQTPEQELYPRLTSQMFRVDDQTLVSNLYTCGPGETLVKEVDGQLVEYYTLAPEGMTAAWVSRDLVSDEILEYYQYQDNQELKYSPDGSLLQANYMVNQFSELPQAIRDSLSAWPLRDQIFLYSTKSWGQIVETRQ